jgi:DNA-binding LacI/PurR family transcriptional regulator
MKKALFLSHTVNPFNVLKLDSIYAEAKRLGWAVQSAEFGWTAWSIADIVAALKPDGIIFGGGRLPGPVDLRPLRRFPAVYVDTNFPAPPGCTTVRSDAEAIADLAADELLASAPTETAFFSVMRLPMWSRRLERRVALRCTSSLPSA